MEANAATRRHRRFNTSIRLECIGRLFSSAMSKNTCARLAQADAQMRSRDSQLHAELFALQGPFVARAPHLIDRANLQYVT